ncbi:sarcosine oxidase subunit gamma [Azospirillum sp. ST 5-10]|uniref:sarcosine oxidase subunit gamma n=1 Tax=unclassified Azospirillum TaxID=2630922 RepID=UPI003F49F507
MSVPDASPAAALVPAWRPAGPWDGLLRPGRLGNPEGRPGLVVRPAEPAAAATLTAPADGVADLAAALAARHGVDLPLTPRRARGPGIAVQWAGPRQWLATGDDAGLTARLAASLAGTAAVVDQGGARAALLLAGPAVRDVLAKGCVIDLDARLFRPAEVALTQVAHMAVHLVRSDDGAAFELSVGRSLAGSLWRWLVTAAEEHGLLVPADGLPLPPREREGTRPQVGKGEGAAVA